MDKKMLGTLGEEAALELLRRRGYKILCRNFRCALGELDIVAREGATVIFVEVKSRSTEEFGDPLEAVGRGKQRKLARLAQYYLLTHNLHGSPCRFDVVSVLLGTDGRIHSIDHIPNAFEV
ncbi:MAG: YraN family protein [Armatimonadota bacterium]|nr:YraN family protein [Armatimonadota bacterium]